MAIAAADRCEDSVGFRFECMSLPFANRQHVSEQKNVRALITQLVTIAQKAKKAA